MVIERGEVANAWRTERWDSLRLLTPNWMCRLPGHAYDGDEPDGYMARPEVAGVHRPLRRPRPCAGATRTRPCGASRRRRGATPSSPIAATGGAAPSCWPAARAAVPLVPALADGCRHRSRSGRRDYRRPSQLDAGGVLVVGASATGLQLAQRCSASGRPVLLATGEHVRMPRLYRGRDVAVVAARSGVLDQRIAQMDDPVRARRLPSPQLVGSDERMTLDLNAVQRHGRRALRPAGGLARRPALFSGSLHNVCALADLKMNRMLDWLRRLGRASRGWAASSARCSASRRPRVAAAPRLGAELGREIARSCGPPATGPTLAGSTCRCSTAAAICATTGASSMQPGLYVLGLPFLRRRKSSFIHGAEDDVREIVAELAGHLDRTAHTKMHNAPTVEAPGTVAVCPR